MIRIYLAGLLCCVLALVSVSGAHFHAHEFGHPNHAIFHPGGATGEDSESSADHDEDADEGVYTIADSEADHLSDHTHHHAVDIDRSGKAFGKAALVATLRIIASWCGFLAAVDLDGRGSVCNFPPPLRPPRTRSRYFVFPPSHAPPALLG